MSTIYTGLNYTGLSARLRVGTYDSIRDVGGHFWHNVRSIRVDPGEIIVLYDKKSGKGSSVEIRESTPNVGSWGNEVQSIAVKEDMSVNVNVNVQSNPVLQNINDSTLQDSLNTVRDQNAEMATLLAQLQSAVAQPVAPTASQPAPSAPSSADAPSVNLPSTIPASLAPLPSYVPNSSPNLPADLGQFSQSDEQPSGISPAVIAAVGIGGVVLLILLIRRK